MNDAATPASSHDMERATAHFEEHGFVVVEGALSPGETRRVRDLVYALCDAEEQAGGKVRGFGFDPDTRNRRLFLLLNRDPVFVRMVENQTALALVRHAIGEPFLLSNFSANITAPGNARMSMHADQGYVLSPWPEPPLAVNIAWLLDDFTEEVGATRYVPGSHRASHGPGKDEHASLPIEAPAGSLLAMSGKLWHQTGDNRTKDRERCGLFAYYVRPWLRTQENWYLNLDPAVLEHASPELREMLGYGRNPSAKL